MSDLGENKMEEKFVRGRVWVYIDTCLVKLCCPRLTEIIFGDCTRS